MSSELNLSPTHVLGNLNHMKKIIWLSIYEGLVELRN